MVKIYKCLMHNNKKTHVLHPNVRPAPSLSSDKDGEVELYLSSFPASPLVFGQIKLSMRVFANLLLSSMLARGSAIMVDCDAGEEPPPRRDCLLAITRPSCTRLNTSKAYG